MKKLIYYIAMSILCILPYSCSLDEEARSEMEKKNYMTNAKEAQDVLLGVYRTTVEDAAYGYHGNRYISRRRFRYNELSYHCQ